MKMTRAGASTVFFGKVAKTLCEVVQGGQPVPNNLPTRHGALTINAASSKHGMARAGELGSNTTPAMIANPATAKARRLAISAGKCETRNDSRSQTRPRAEKCRQM